MLPTLSLLRPTMLHILSLLALLLPKLSFPHPLAVDTETPKLESRPKRHLWDYKSENLKAKNTLHHLSISSTPEHHKRNAESADAGPEPDITTSTSMNPWDDAGRSQILDNDPSVQLWRQCTRFWLNCRKCPLDARCQIRLRPLFPWWKPTSVLDVPDVLTGPVIAGEDGVAEDDAEEEQQCTLHGCQADYCGEGAQCVRGYCVCNVGFKAAGGGGAVVRGFEGLQAVTVWVDHGMACDVPCDTLSCAEVEQVEACFAGVGETEVEEEQPWDGDDGIEASATGGAGAINVPSAMVDGDYIEGIADLGIVGEAN